MDHAKRDYFLLFQKDAETLLSQKKVLDPNFSRGTYQFEVLGLEDKKKQFYPFLQVTDEGEISDAFCTCKVSEKGEGCSHLRASYLKVFNGFEEPLHHRFKKSFWNRLFQMAAKRHGYEPDLLQKEGNTAFIAESKAKEVLFRIEFKNAKAQSYFERQVFQKEEETEETSIKFSNLPQEELEAYRKGHPSHFLHYELSFWSDIAKWLMFKQERNEEYQITFKGEPLPTEVRIQFSDVEIWFHIFDLNWPWLIPSLPTVQTDLKVYDSEEDAIRGVKYDESQKILKIDHHEKRKNGKITGGVQVGDWQYIPNDGFYKLHVNPLLEDEVIETEKIGYILTECHQALEKFIPIHTEKRSCNYTLYFDKRDALHIEMYVFEPGDLKDARSACFSPWVYLPQKGFFLLEDWIFLREEKVIQRENMAEFINNHRLWLHNFAGFQTHLGSLESHLTYHLTEEDELIFDAELNFSEDFDETRHFEEWVYIKGQGFYMKKEAQGKLPLHPGLKIAKEEISHFIANHNDELESVQGFYNPDLPILKIGLNIKINDEDLITLIPEMKYREGVNPNVLKRFGNYVYMPEKGFSEIPASSRLPARYQVQTVISPSQEASFLAYELDPLKPYILNIDPRLSSPTELKLKIRKIVPSRSKKGKEWLLDLIYSAEEGSIDIFTIWDAFQAKKRHLFSEAGLLYLKEPRFNWIRQLSSKRLDRKKGMVRLNTLEWIRLSVFEEIDKPTDPELRRYVDELENLQTHKMLDTSRLKASLRPYQEQGVGWLWFLYCHGLSGLLCDDMGLGKTHQAMALLSAIMSEDPEKENKYLVVCPTSVIYHWQELLKRFLPDLRVCTYYGHERTLDHFDEQYDLVLTSYGIMRTGKENLRQFRFELAIFDEIQIAKNQASQTHKALRSIRSQMRLGLTGTPIENRLKELKSLIDIVLPSYMPIDPIFRDVFINPIEKFQDPEKKNLLARLVKPFILRRKKSEVLTDLPEKIEEVAYCDLSEVQKELYKDVARKMRDTVYSELKDSSKSVSFLHVFSALSTLKQICDHPALVSEEIRKDQANLSGKWDLFVELLNEARDSGQKVVVFSQYLEMLAIIERYLKRKGIGFATIKGSTRDRPKQLQRFREDPGCEVFVASLLAAGVGIDLTVASIVIHYDRWWNPAKENQATDRVHRIGQNRGVQVFKLVTKNTIEEHIHAMIEKKKGLLEDIIGQDDQINYLSREELLQVFEKMFQENL